MAKLLKDHGCMPHLIGKEEVSTLFKQINQTLYDKRKDLLILDYPGYIQFIIQFSLNAYNRPPHNYRHLPAIESLKAMFEVFK